MVIDAFTASAITVNAEHESRSDSEDDNFEKSQALSPMQDIHALFQDLEYMASNCHIYGAIIHLQRARHAFLAANREDSTPEKGLLIIDVLRNKS